MKIVANVIKWIFLVALLVVALLPIVWLIISSFKTNLEISTNPFSFPASPQWQNYVNAFQMGDLARLFLNSVIIAAGAVALNVIVCALAGFVLSREHFKGRDAIHGVLTAGILIPIIAFLVPYFSMMTKLHLLDTHIALILAYGSVNIPVSIFIITAAMKSIPKELEEAAIIDGCSFFQRFSKVVFPLSQSSLVTAGTFCFIYAWNEFQLAFLLTRSVASRTIQLGIRYFTSQFITDYGSMYAALVVSMLPSIIAYIFLHNKIVGGLTAGAVKG